jgi:hypothetical protein
LKIAEGMFVSKLTPAAWLAREARIQALERGYDILGPWMAAALDDDLVCDEMKQAISEWFSVSPLANTGDGKL